MTSKKLKTIKIRHKIIITDYLLDQWGSKILTTVGVTKLPLLVTKLELTLILLKIDGRLIISVLLLHVTC